MPSGCSTIRASISRSRAASMPARASSISASRPRDGDELAEVYGRLKAADRPVLEEGADHLLLRQVGEELDHRSGRRDLGSLPHRRRGHRLRRQPAALRRARRHAASPRCRASQVLRAARRMSDGPTTSCSSAPAIPPARSWPRRCSTGTARAASAPFRRAAFPKGEVHPMALELLRRARLSDRRAALEELGRVRRPGRAAARFRLHRLRQCRRRGLPDLAGPADDRPLGHRGSGGGRRRRAARGFPRPPSLICSERIGLFLALPLESIDELSLQTRLREIGRREGRGCIA